MKKKITVSFPYLGKYTSLFKEFFENFGLTVELPPKISDRTVKIGTRHSSEMICFPYKVTLGNFIELLEKRPDIDYLIMYDSRGRCRFRHYHVLQKKTLEQLGYRNEMVALNLNNLISFPKKLNPNLSKKAIIQNYLWLWRGIKKLSRRREVNSEKPNVLIIGEVYTCLEPEINYHLEERLEKYGLNPINAVELESFIKDSLKEKTFRKFLRGRHWQKASRYLNGPLGGHGLENIASLLEYIEKGIDGAIWLRPLSCMPETTVDPIIKKICQEKNLPLLIFDIDESNFALNIETRIETFVEQIKLDYGTKKGLPRL